MKFILIPFLTLFLGNPSPSPIESIIEADLEYLTDFYKERHLNPEVSLEEKETAMALAKELRAIGFEVTENYGGYGVVGIFKNGDGPQILYRTDMDALPMEEKTELDYASTKKINYNGDQAGVMHSCGHDMHMTSLVGTARAMVKMKDQWKGTLMMIGQPAEEIGKGSGLMLDKGLYSTFGVPDYGLGLHCSPTIPSGQIGVREGFSMATTESADIIVHGFGGHGAAPHMSVDPVVIASMIVMDLQTIVSRSLKPTESAVITVGSFKSGHKHNIIPDQAHLQLTIRTYKEEVRLMVHKRIEEISRGIAIAAGLPEEKMPEVIFNDSRTPANYNNPALTATLMSSAGKAIGNDNVLDAEPQMVGEDFSRYGTTEHNVPTVLYWLGTVPDDRMESGDLPGLHSPFYFPEIQRTLKTAIEVNTTTMLDLFNAKS